MPTQSLVDLSVLLGNDFEDIRPLEADGGLSKLFRVMRKLGLFPAAKKQKAYKPKPYEQSTYSSADFLKRLVKWYARQGIQVECVQTDNGFAFTNRRSNNLPMRPLGWHSPIEFTVQYV